MAKQHTWATMVEALESRFIGDVDEFLEGIAGIDPTLAGNRDKWRWAFGSVFTDDGMLRPGQDANLELLIRTSAFSATSYRIIDRAKEWPVSDEEVDRQIERIDAFRRDVLAAGGGTDAADPD